MSLGFLPDLQYAFHSACDFNPSPRTNVRAFLKKIANPHHDDVCQSLIRPLSNPYRARNLISLSTLWGVPHKRADLTTLSVVSVSSGGLDDCPR